MSGIDYYEVLDVAKTATAEQIKAAHRKLVRIAHPDQGGDATQFRLVQEAYETLHDRVKRTAYDTANSATCAAAPSPPKPTPPEKPNHMRGRTSQPPPTRAPQSPPRQAPPPPNASTPPRQPPPPATFPTPAPGYRQPLKPRRGGLRTATIIFWVTAGLALGQVAFTMLVLIVDSLHGGPSTNAVVILWGIPAIGYAVWWLMGGPIPRALAIWAHSYTAFVALFAAFLATRHDNAEAIFFAAQAACLIAVPLTGRFHRRRAR